MLSGQATLRVPGTIDTSNPAAIGYTDVEIDIRALLGHSFTIGAMPAFIDLQVAQRLRGDGAAQRIPRRRHVRRAGRRQRWMLLAQCFNVISEGAGSPVFGSYDYFKLQLSAVYALTRDLVGAGRRLHHLCRPQCAAGERLVFGVGYKF